MASCVNIISALKSTTDFLLYVWCILGTVNYTWRGPWASGLGALRGQWWGWWDRKYRLLWSRGTNRWPAETAGAPFFYSFSQWISLQVWDMRPAHTRPALHYKAHVFWVNVYFFLSIFLFEEKMYTFKCTGGLPLSVGICFCQIGQYKQG